MITDWRSCVSKHYMVKPALMATHALRYYCLIRVLLQVVYRTQRFWLRNLMLFVQLLWEFTLSWIPKQSTKLKKRSSQDSRMFCAENLWSLRVAFWREHWTSSLPKKVKASFSTSTVRDWRPWCNCRRWRHQENCAPSLRQSLLSCFLMSRGRRRRWTLKISIPSWSRCFISCSVCQRFVNWPSTSTKTSTTNADHTFLVRIGLYKLRHCLYSCNASPKPG